MDDMMRINHVPVSPREDSLVIIIGGHWKKLGKAVGRQRHRPRARDNLIYIHIIQVST